MASNPFVDRVAGDAIQSQRETGVPASVTIAQAILESGWGKSGLSTSANNFFGIKGEGPAGHVTMRTREVFNGVETFVDADFRKYHSPAESFIDHGRFLRDNPRYAQAFQHTDDPERFAQEIQRAGYATDPNYAQLLASLIRGHDLQRFDQLARGGAPIPPSQPSPPPGTNVLERGQRGDAVQWLQQQLARGGFDPGAVDGAFGPDTEAALRRFQAAKGLEVDGIAGPNTLRALQEV